MSRIIQGTCICQAVKFQVYDDFLSFKLCHCQFCQKVSGSSNVANAFALPEYIRWLKGTQHIQSFDVPKSQVRRVFCKICGTNLPFTTQNGRFLVVPVGCLSEQPRLPPQEVKSWHERMPWYDSIDVLEQKAKADSIS